MTQAAAIATAGGRRSRRPSHSSCSARGKYRSPRPPRLRRRARIEPVRTMRIPTPTWSRTRTRACCRPCSPRRRSGGARRRRRSTVRRSGCPLALACVADRFFPQPLLSRRHPDVRARYQNRTLVLPLCADEGKHMPGAPEFCTLEAFVERVDELTPRDWEAECAAGS